MRFLTIFFILFALQANNAAPTQTQQPRARDLGIVVGKFPTGPLNAITDVSGVKVGHITLSSGSLQTGVTVIIPRDNIWENKVSAGIYVLNGNGELTGRSWLERLGALEVPVILTNTLSVGTAHTAVVKWMLKRYAQLGLSDTVPLPVVAECDDSFLNDSRGLHIKEEHVLKALANVSSGPLSEGSVGAGTGMVAYEFKSGIGTSSRKVALKDKAYIIGVLVLDNHGHREELTINGIPIGKKIADLKQKSRRDGSIVVVTATDAPLEARQLNELAKRSAIGVAQAGSKAGYESGEFMIAFSTARKIPHYPETPILSHEVLSDTWLDDLFAATIEATQEAILNALVASKTTKGRDGNMAYGLPTERLRELLKN